MISVAPKKGYGPDNPDGPTHKDTLDLHCYNSCIKLQQEDASPKEDKHILLY